MIKHPLYISKLIFRHLAGNLSTEEENELNSWRQESTANEELFNQICDTENFAKYYQQRSKFDQGKGWKQVSRKIQSHEHRRTILRWSRYAAIFLLPICTAILLLNTLAPEKQTVAKQIQHQKSEILPGAKKAVLTLANGQVVDLNNASNKVLEEKDGTAIKIDSTELNYQQGTKPETKEELYNTLEIPRGGEYVLTLSDGSRVFLNSMTSLRFPVHFTGKRRVIELQGEAYFEVAKGPNPFIIKTASTEVEVLGTHFNISAYQGEDYQATLVEGSVKVKTAKGSSCILNPSEQAYVKPGTDNLNVRKVDVTLYTSWVNGKINFKDERLEDIMNSLSRWYDMSIFYSEPSLKNLRFGCNINRDKDIVPFLELLEKTEKVSIIIQGKSITFKSNH